MPTLSQDAWVISSGIEQQIKTKIETKGTALKDWDVNINYGIKTGFNEAFIIDNETKERLYAEDASSANIIKPILRGRDIKRYTAEWAGLWLINSHNNPPVKIDDYPAIKKHLDDYYPQLEKRQDKGETPYNLRNCAYLKEFEKEKIVWKRIGSILRFSYENNTSLCLDSTCFATGKYIKYLVALLNSTMGTYQLFENSPKTGTGDLIISVQALEPLKIPIPKPEIEQPFITLVDRILADKKAGKDTSDLEKQIDDLVYQLYGLNEDEILIVEGK